MTQHTDYQLCGFEYRPGNPWRDMGDVGEYCEDDVVEGTDWCKDHEGGKAPDNYDGPDDHYDDGYIPRWWP